MNPIILSAAGLDFKLVFVGTCIAAAVATLLMGVYAKYPFALASGMGLNSVLTYGVIIGMNLSWQQAMGIIVIEGLCITILVLTNLREMVMDAIPKSLKLAIGAGIGLFIAYIGFISYCLIKVFSGKWKEIHPLMWFVAIMFALYFIFVSQTI